MRSWVLFGLAAMAFSGCGGAQASRDDKISKEIEETVRDADLRAKDSRTLSSLSKLEEALDAYIKAERSIPDTLEQLVPRYLAEIPTVEINVRGHRDTDRVRVYPSVILRDGQIDGSQLKDSGRWGYVHNERQVVVFIDCTHQSSRGHPWYQQHGVF